jgi:hypothetical protein
MAKVNELKDVFKYVNMQHASKDACWEWKGKVNAKDGRPYITIDGKRRPAYAVALEAFKGKEDGMVLHSCDNPICCNPHHLSYGTHQDNMNEMKERERHGLPKIVVRAILKLLSEGRTQQSIADLYGISRESVSSISTGRRNTNE